MLAISAGSMEAGPAEFLQRAGAMCAFRHDSARTRPLHLLSDGQIEASVLPKPREKGRDTTED